MRTLNLRIVGSTPILLHRVANHQLRDQIASSAKKGESLEVEALKVMSRDEGGKPALPISWMWDAIRKGCSHIIVDEGKQLSFVTLQQKLHLPTGFVVLKGNTDPTPEFEVYTSVQHSAPGSRKMITVVAPMFKRWILDMRICVEGEHPNDLLLQRIFNEAGKTGIGLFHPPKKQFGMFKVFPVR